MLLKRLNGNVDFNLKSKDIEVIAAGKYLVVNSLIDFTATTRQKKLEFLRENKNLETI